MSKYRLPVHHGCWWVLWDRFGSRAADRRQAETGHEQSVDMATRMVDNRLRVA